MNTAGLFPQSIHISHTKKRLHRSRLFTPCPHNESLWRRMGEEEGFLQKGSPSPIFLVPFLTAALNDHALEGAFAGAAGLHVRGVLQRHVHEAAMVGAHGPGGTGAPRGTDTFRQRKGQLAEPVVLTFAVDVCCGNFIRS